MSFDQFNQGGQQSQPYARSATIDAGLQAYMRQVYNLMCAGLAVTGITAFIVAHVPALAHLILGTPLVWVVVLAPLGFVFFGFTPARMRTMPTAQLQRMFYIFSAVMGLSMASLFFIYTQASIGSVFFITAGMFAGASLLGYTTKADMTSFGGFFRMGLIGLVIASIVAIFFHSPALYFALSVVSVLIFTGLTAWETQTLKESYSSSAGSEDANTRIAIMGALQLYLNFINLFQAMMRLMGNRR